MDNPGNPPNNQYNPTVRPVNPFDPHRDAEILYLAMDSQLFYTSWDWSRNYEMYIVDILANRVNSQRQEIAIQFKTIFGKDLISEVKSELSGKMRDLVVALVTPTYEFLAKEIYDAINDIFNEGTIIEIICTASNAEINNIKMAYYNLFGNDLEKDLMGKTSGLFRRLLASLCRGKRNENTFVDVASAQADAQNLLQAYELQFKTDDSTFNMILCSRSFCQLQQVFLEYHCLTGRDFDDVFKSELSKDIVNIRAVVKSVRDKMSYFAHRLLASRPSFGSDDRPLIRIVATRCEIDMVEIKNAYMSICGRSLADDIERDTHGEYNRCLMALVHG